MSLPKHEVYKVTLIFSECTAAVVALHLTSF